jgi:hypothetical protein
MVQETEAWFMGDGESLYTYYLNRHRGTRLIALPKPEDVELIPDPKEYLRSLVQNEGTSYKEVTDGAALLTDYLRLDKVSNLPHALLLIERLKSLLPLR